MITGSQERVLERVTVSCWTRPTEVAHWICVLFFVGNFVTLEVFGICRGEYWLSILAPMPALPVWIGSLDRSSLIGRAVSFDDKTLTFTKHGEEVWSLPWANFYGIERSTGLRPPRVTVVSKTGERLEFATPGGMSTAVQLLRVLLLERADPRSLRLKPPSPPPSWSRTIWILTISGVVALGSAVAYSVAQADWLAAIERDPSSYRAGWVFPLQWILVCALASVSTLRAAFWVLLHRRPDLLDPNRTQHQVSAAEVRRLVNKGRPPVVDLAEGVRYRYMALDQGKPVYRFLVVGGTVVAVFLFWGACVVFNPWGPFGTNIRANAATFGFMTLMGLTALVCSLLLAYFAGLSVIRLWICDDEVTVRQGQIDVKRHGKVICVENSVVRRMRLPLTGGSHFGELEWFGDKRKSVALDRRYLEPVESRP